MQKIHAFNQQKNEYNRGKNNGKEVAFMVEQHNKLVLAVLQEEDYDGTVAALNQHGFFVTKLASSGGFLKKKNRRPAMWN